jgi:hypothetical protein
VGVVSVQNIDIESRQAEVHLLCHSRRDKGAAILRVAVNKA